VKAYGKTYNPPLLVGATLLSSRNPRQVLHSLFFFFCFCVFLFCMHSLCLLESGVFRNRRTARKKKPSSLKKPDPRSLRRKRRKRVSLISTILRFLVDYYSSSSMHAAPLVVNGVCHWSLAFSILFLLIVGDFAALVRGLLQICLSCGSPFLASI